MCEIDASVGDYCDYRPLSDTVQRAAKPYRCDTCRGGIAPGARYQRVVSLVEGEIHTERSCLGCRDDRTRFAKAHGYESCNPTGFVEWLDECVEEGGPGVRRWREMRRRIEKRGAA